VRSIFISIALLAGSFAAFPALAQVFEPVRINSGGENGTKNSITVQASNFKWDSFGLEGEVGVLIAGDFSIGKHFSAGGWYATDGQSIRIAGGRSSANLQWYNLHLTGYFLEKPRTTLGLSVGALGTTVSGGGASFDTTWGEFDLVGSLALDGSSNHAPRWTLGYSLGYLAGASASVSSSAKPADAFTYGLSLSYRASKLLSIDASAWNMSLQTGVSITRYNVGVGFHF
jgi:hypothetical protein